MARIRVVVVEDSLTVRKCLVNLLTSDPLIEVVGEAEDGFAAIRICESLRPDVITLDIVLPTMSGVAVTEHVMAHFPTPILIVSASSNRGELFRTYEALAAGALDVLEKPSGDAATQGEWERALLSTVKLISRIKVITHPRAKLGRPARIFREGIDLRPRSAEGRVRAVAIGASTGGPGAIRDILRAMPTDFARPLLIVLHTAEPFGVALAEWLDGLSPLRVACARDGEPLPGPGQARVIMAPPNAHLVVEDGLLRLSRAPERHSCRPSVDVLFESLAAELGAEVIACLLTGMGKDGAAGLLALRRAGATCIAQDEATSVVYGMPREAALLGAADRILPLPEIAPTIVQLMAGAEGRR